MPCGNHKSLHELARDYLGLYYFIHVASHNTNKTICITGSRIIT